MNSVNKVLSVVILHCLLVITMQQEPTPTYVKKDGTITFTCSSTASETAPTIEVKRTGLRSDDMTTDSDNANQLIAEANGTECVKKGIAILEKTNNRYACRQEFTAKVLKVTFTITKAEAADSLIIGCYLKGTTNTVGNQAKYIVPTDYTMDLISGNQIITGQTISAEAGKIMPRTQLTCNVTGWGLDPTATVNGKAQTLDRHVTRQSSSGTLVSHSREADFWLKDYTPVEADNGTKIVCQVKNQDTAINVMKEVTLIVTKKPSGNGNGGGAGSLGANLMLLSAMVFLIWKFNK